MLYVDKNRLFACIISYNLLEDMTLIHSVWKIHRLESSNLFDILKFEYQLNLLSGFKEEFCKNFRIRIRIT
jgi:hypothetical protein